MAVACPATTECLLLKGGGHSARPAAGRTATGHLQWRLAGGPCGSGRGPRHRGCSTLDPGGHLCWRSLTALRPGTVEQSALEWTQKQRRARTAALADCNAIIALAAGGAGRCSSGHSDVSGRRVMTRTVSGIPAARARHRSVSFADSTSTLHGLGKRRRCTSCSPAKQEEAKTRSFCRELSGGGCLDTALAQVDR